MDSYRLRDPGLIPSVVYPTAKMFEPPPPPRLGVDHNWCLLNAAGFSFPDVNEKTPRVPGSKYSFKCTQHALRLGLVLIEDSRGHVRCHDSVAPGGYMVDWRPMNTYGDVGWTAAHAAAFNGQKEALLLLLANDWSPDLPDKNGKTVVDILNDEGYTDLALYVRKKYLDNMTPKERKKQVKERLKRERERFEANYKIHYDEYGRGMIV